MVLVTGGTGLLGTHLIYELLKAGEKVRAIHRTGSDLSRVQKTISYYRKDKGEALLENLQWFEADLADVVSLEEAFEGVEKVYHCAALVSFDPRRSKELLMLNPESTANIINLSLDKKVQKLVHVSSVAALGRKTENDYITEASEWIAGSNNSVYAKSKYRAELEVWRGIQEGLNAVIVNPCIILGPGKWNEGSTAIFGTIANGFKYYTMGTNAYVDVRDVATVMINLMNSSIHSQRFIVASENLSYKKMFEFIAGALNVEAPYIEVHPWLSNLLWRLEKVKTTLFGGSPLITRETARTAQRTYYYDNAKIKEALNYQFRPVRETIHDMARYYRRDHR